jgi:ATP-dependent helicase HrpA
VFIDGKTIRTQAAFKQNLCDNKVQLMTVANEASKITLEIMTLYTAIETALQRLNVNNPLAKDLNEQLDLINIHGLHSQHPLRPTQSHPPLFKSRPIPPG